MIAVGAIARGAQRAFPGALVGSWVGALIVAAAAWWLFRLLRTTRGSRAGADRDRPGVRSRFSNFSQEKIENRDLSRRLPVGDSLSCTDFRRHRVHIGGVCEVFGPFFGPRRAPGIRGQDLDFLFRSPKNRKSRF